MPRSRVVRVLTSVVDTESRRVRRCPTTAIIRGREIRGPSGHDSGDQWACPFSGRGAVSGKTSGVKAVGRVLALLPGRSHLSTKGQHGGHVVRVHDQVLVQDARRVGPSLRYGMSGQGVFGLETRGSKIL